MNHEFLARREAVYPVEIDGPLGTQGSPVQGRLTLDALRQAVSRGEIDTVIVAMTDMQGRLIGKRLTARFFLETNVSPQLFCDYFLATDMEMTLVPGYASASWEKGYGDFALVPDISTLRAIPWLPKTALVLSDVTTSGGVSLDHSPRQVLRRQLDRLAALGFSADMAAELEFYLFNQTFEDARSAKYENLKFSSWYPEDGHIFQTSKDEPYIRAIRNLMELADIPVEGSKAECSPGQQEINLQYADALETCDRLALYKNGCKEIAHQMGKSVSFMAKLGENLSGNSCHIHLSLRDIETGAAGFHDPSRAGGMSDLFRRFLAGAIRHAPAATYFYAPNINSYKRFTAGTFAPTRLADADLLGCLTKVRICNYCCCMTLHNEKSGTPSVGKPAFTAAHASSYVEGTLKKVPGLAALHRMASMLIAERVPGSGRVLVLGAGGGLELKALADANPGWNFYGIDPSADMILLAEETVGPHLSRVQLHQGYIETAEEGPFDAAVCFLTLHFVARDQRIGTLQQLRRRLVPGAPFVVAHISFPQGEPERSKWIARHVAFGGPASGNAESAWQAIATKLSILSPEEDESMLREAGFSDASLIYAGLTFRGWVAYA